MIYQLLENTSLKQFEAVGAEKTGKLDQVLDKSPTMKLIDFCKQQSQAYHVPKFQLCREPLNSSKTIHCICSSF